MVNTFFSYVTNTQAKHLRLLDRNSKDSKYLKKLKLFEYQVFQIDQVLELEKHETLNSTIFQF